MEPRVDIRYRNLVEDRDRHGNVRYYVRLPGRPKQRIRAEPGTEDFARLYAAAIAAPATAPAAVGGIGSGKAPEGSFRALCIAYFASPEFARLDVSTRLWRRRALEKICERHGANPVAQMQPIHVKRIRDEVGDQPAVANQRLKALKALLKWGFEDERIRTNPAATVRKIAYASDGHATWSAEDVEKFEATHAIGTIARLTMTLLLYVGCRREDVVRLGPQHVRGGRVRYTQAKNEDRNPVEIDIPLHPVLARVIEATPLVHMTFVTTAYGRPFSPDGLGNAMRDWCRQAGLAGRSAHGLRKALATMLAERDATDHQIMSVTGHQSLEEVTRYTRAARRRKLATAAMAKLEDRSDPAPDKTEP